jgi:hypothetical protein
VRFTANATLSFSNATPSNGGLPPAPAAGRGVALEERQLLPELRRVRHR